MVGGLASGGIAVDVALYAVIARAADVDGAALHEEVFGAVDAVGHGLGDVEGGVFQCHVFACLDGVLRVARHVERAFLGKLGVALDVEASLLRAIGGIDQRVGGAVHHFHLDAFAVLDVHGGTAVYGCRVGQGQAVQRYRGLVGARHVELAVCRRAAQRVGDFLLQVVALDDGDVGTVDGRRDIACHVASHGDGGGSAVVVDSDSGVGHAGVIYRHLVDVGEWEFFPHDGKRLTVGVGHVARLCGGELVCDAAHLDIQRLARGCYRQHEGYEERMYLFHFTTIFWVLLLVLTM